MPDQVILGIDEIRGAFQVSEKTIRNWTDRNVDPMPVHKQGRGIPREYDLAKCIQWKCRQEVTRATGGDEGSALDYTQERAKLARQQTRKTELEVEVLKGNLIPAEQVIEGHGNLIMAFKSRMLSIPTKLAAILETETRAEIEATLSEAIHEALDELSNRGATGVGQTPAETDREPVGRPKPETERGSELGARPVEH